MALSPKALGILFHVYAHGALGGAKGLSEAIGVGREYVSSGLIELRSNNLVALINGKTDKGNFWSTVEITQKGVDLCKYYARKGKYRAGKPASVPMRKTRSSTSQNSHLANYPNSIEAYSVNQGDALSASQEKEETYIGGVDMWLEPEDLEIEIERDRKKKAEEKSENKRQGYATRQKIRATRPVEKWTPTDVVNYYAEMVKTVWHLEEVATTARPKFIKMLANFRDDFGTNGAEEKELLDRFISKNRHDTEKRDPDRLFTSFIYTAPSMLDEVRRAMVPELLPPADKYNRKGL